jgi:hypothetical protein
VILPVEEGNALINHVNYGEVNNALLLDLNAGQQLLLQYIRFIEEQNQMDMSQERAGTYRVERLEGVVDPVHLGTRVSGAVTIQYEWNMARECRPSRLYARATPF